MMMTSSDTSSSHSQNAPFSSLHASSTSPKAVSVGTASSSGSSSVGHASVDLVSFPPLSVPSDLPSGTVARLGSKRDARNNVEVDMHMGTRNNNNGRSSMEAVVDGKSGYNMVTGGSGQLGPAVDGDGSRVGGNTDVKVDGDSGNVKPNDKSYTCPSVSRIVERNHAIGPGGVDGIGDNDLAWMQLGVRGLSLIHI